MYNGPTRPHKVEEGKALIVLMREYRETFGSGPSRALIAEWIEEIEDISRILLDSESVVTHQGILEFITSNKGGI